MLDFKLLQNTKLLKLKVRKFGQSRKGALSDASVAKIAGIVEPSTFATEEEKRNFALAVEKARKLLKLGKKIADCPEYQAAAEYIATTKKNIVEGYCNPSFIDEGLFSVINACVGDVDQILRDANQRLARELVPAFIEVYEACIESDRRTLGEQFRADDYPDADKLAAAFEIEHRWTALAVPEGLPPEIRAQEELKLRQSYERAEQAIAAALWEEFQAFLDHITDRLQTNADGKRKKFNDTLFQGVTEFTKAFKNRNAFGDAKLAELVEQAEALLNGIGAGKDTAKAAQTVRESESARERAREAFAKLKGSVDAGIENMPGRSFNFDEDDAAAVA